MNRPLPFLQALAGLLLLGGLGLFLHGRSLPVYTDRDAPDRLSHALQDLPRDERFSEWYR